MPSRRDYYATQLLPRQGVEAESFFARVGICAGVLCRSGHGTVRIGGESSMPSIFLGRARSASMAFNSTCCKPIRDDHGTTLLMMCDVAAAVAPGFSGRSGAGYGDTCSRSAWTIFARRSREELAQQPSIYRLPDGRMLVTPFYPESSAAGYWSNVVDEMTKRNAPIALVPVLLNFGLHANSFAHFSYGLSYWGDRDPASFADDNFFGRVRALRSGRLATMLPIAPQDVRPKISMMWEAANTRLFRAEWSKAIAEAPDFVPPRSLGTTIRRASEISPSSGTQYVFYDLTRFYTHWFKTGQMPAIVKDAIFYTHRRQVERLGEPPVSTDVPMKLNGAEALHNDIEVIAFLTSPAQLEIEIDGHRYTAEAQAGLAELRAPAAVGRPRFRVFCRELGVPVVEKPQRLADRGPSGRRGPNLCRRFEFSFLYRGTEGPMNAGRLRFALMVNRKVIPARLPRWGRCDNR